MEEWEKKLDQILQGSVPPPPPPTTITNPVASTPSAPKIPALAPFNGTSEDVSPAINRIHQYASILIGQYPDMRLGGFSPSSAYPVTALVHHPMG
ncbi:hypothetical protein AX16_010950 [Volvariella volvacea WC 439]|nr:hypothetical protein AX16_010950 [Volvariella volvacea WC 439]